MKHLWLGDRDAAARRTRKAVAIARRLGDPDAVRVYGFNRTRIETREDEEPAFLAGATRR